MFNLSNYTSQMMNFMYEYASDFTRAERRIVRRVNSAIHNGSIPFGYIKYTSGLHNVVPQHLVSDMIWNADAGKKWSRAFLFENSNF